MTTASSAGQGNRLHVGDFKKMILGAKHFFDREVDTINALNVFPVPDGDTGTNMSMTLEAAVSGTNDYKGQSVGELSEIVASKALMGARGNSGVILSQILRGIARGLRKKEYISPAELSKAFQYGVVYAYRAVSKPVEGTILTVAREMARGIRTAVHKGENLYGSMEEAIKSGKKALDQTTDMLPALKEAGVVDAGGLGLLVFIEGCLYSLKRSISEITPHISSNITKNINHSTTAGAVSERLEPFNTEHPYCTEIIVMNKEGAFQALENELQALGDSLIFAADNRAAKIHIHTASPGTVLQAALKYGSLHDIKIDNMLDQHEKVHARRSSSDNTVILPGTIPHEKGEIGIISVSFGEGFREIFLSLGTDEIVFGGQTMNPKVEDLLRAVENLPQQAAVILPNNKNIIMVAEQVKNLTNKKVEVLKTKTLPEGLAALLAFNASRRIEDNMEAMGESISRVKSGLVTFATRDATVQGEIIRSGQFLGLSGEKIISSGNEISDIALALAEKLITRDSDIITLFYGEEIQRREASELAEIIEEEYPDLEVELHYGGQPIYYYIFSVE